MRHCRQPSDPAVPGTQGRRSRVASCWMSPLAEDSSPGTAGPPPCDHCRVMGSTDGKRLRHEGVLLPALLATIALLLSMMTIALDVANAGTEIQADAQLEPGWLACLTGLAQLVPGVLLLRRLPRHPVAWILVIS